VKTTANCPAANRTKNGFGLDGEWMSFVAELQKLSGLHWERVTRVEKSGCEEEEARWSEIYGLAETARRRANRRPPSRVVGGTGGAPPRPERGGRWGPTAAFSVDEKLLRRPLRLVVGRLSSTGNSPTHRRRLLVPTTVVASTAALPPDWASMRHRSRESVACRGFHLSKFLPRKRRDALQCKARSCYRMSSVRLSVCDVGGSWPHRLKILET